MIINFSVQENRLQMNNGNGLPFFQGYIAGAERRIHHKHQAIIPSYQLNCCGNITEWGVDLNPFSYSITLGDHPLQLVKQGATAQLIILQSKKRLFLVDQRLIM